MPETVIESTRVVGADTIGIELRTPAQFAADPGQFVMVRAEIGGEEETGYYTLSSPDVEQTFEITVAVDSNGTLGPWLRQREEGESIRFEGPFGDVTYQDDGSVLVLAKGPGLGPAIGIAERAIGLDEAATVLYEDEDPPHSDRLAALRADGATVNAATAAGDMAALLTEQHEHDRTFIFGFDGFVGDAEVALEEAGYNVSDISIEKFGPT